jgi:hypothetical protein
MHFSTSESEAQALGTKNNQLTSALLQLPDELGRESKNISLFTQQ